MRSSIHDTFVIERSFNAPPERVFAAWATPEAKSRWFGPASADGYELDFRVGGREHMSAAGGDHVYEYDALYEDIVADERIVYSYNMHVDGSKMSVSVSTVEFSPSAAGTDLRYTEQGVYLDGLDTPEARRHGTEELIDKLSGAVGA